MADDKTTEKIFIYFKDGLSAVEKFDFENKIKSDPKLAKDIDDYKNVLEGVRVFSTQKELKEKLNTIHSELNIKDIDANAIETEKNVNMNSNKSLLLPLLLSALVAVIFSYGFLKIWGQGSMQKSEVNKTETAKLTGLVEEEVDTTSKKEIAPVISKIVAGGALEKGAIGSSLAISRNGLFVTSFSLLKDARSIHLISKSPTVVDYKAEIISSDVESDIAILKIKEPIFKDLGSIPYKIATIETGLGQDIYTLGFPADNIKYAQGAVTAKNALFNDSSRYELSIPAASGFYGAPIFSANGNLVAFMTGKNVTTQSSYALKSTYFMQFAEKQNAVSSAEKIFFSPKNDLFGRTRPEQVDILKYFVFQVKVYY